MARRGLMWRGVSCRDVTWRGVDGVDGVQGGCARPESGGLEGIALLKGVHLALRNIPLSFVGNENHAYPQAIF